METLKTHKLVWAYISLQKCNKKALSRNTRGFLVIKYYFFCLLHYLLLWLRRHENCQHRIHPLT